MKKFILLLFFFCISSLTFISSQENLEEKSSLKFLQQNPTSRELAENLITKFGGHKFTLRTVWKNEVCLRHYTDKAIISPEATDELFKKDATWYLERGLDGRKDCFSFRSENYPNDFLRYINGFVYRQKPDGSDLFDDQASYRIEFGTFGDLKGYVLESCNMPGFYLAHTNWSIILIKKDNADPILFLWNFDKALYP